MFTEDELRRLRTDQLDRLIEVGGDLGQLSDQELDEIIESGEDYSDLGAGFASLGSALQTGLAGILGSEDLAEQARRTQEEIALRRTPDVPSIIESFEEEGILGGLADVPEYIQEQLFFSAPQLAGQLGAGLIGTRLGGPRAGAAAAIGAGTPAFAGYNIQRQMEEQGIGIEDAQVAKAFAVGTGQAALDALVGRTLGVFGPRRGAEEIAKAANRGMGSRIIAKGVEGARVEALTEFGQQALEIVQANPEKFFEFGPEVQRELAESAIAGGLIGGTISAPAGIRGPSRKEQDEAKIKDLEEHLEEEKKESQRMEEEAARFQGETLLIDPPRPELPAPPRGVVTRQDFEVPPGGFRDERERIKDRVRPEGVGRAPTFEEPEIPEVLEGEVVGALPAVREQDQVPLETPALPRGTRAIQVPPTPRQRGTLEGRLAGMREVVSGVTQPTTTGREEQILQSRRSEAVDPFNDDRSRQLFNKLNREEEEGNTVKAKNTRQKLQERLREIGYGAEEVSRLLSGTPAQREQRRLFSQKVARQEAEQTRETAKQAYDSVTTSKFNQRAERIRKDLGSELRRLGLSDVALRMDRVIRPEPETLAEGVTETDKFGKVLIALSSQIYSPGMSDAELKAKLREVMNHEMIHAMKELGLFTDAEYQSLVKAATNQKFVDRQGKERLFSYLDRAKALNPDAPPGVDLLELQQEEAVAELFRDWAAGRKKVTGKPQNLFQKIIKFIKTLGGILDKQGVRSPEEIFEAIQSGEIGRRERVGRGDGTVMYSRKGRPEMGINVRYDSGAGIDYAEEIVSGRKTLETRNTDSLRPYVGQRVGIVRTGRGPAEAIGAVTVGEPIVAGEAEFDSARNQHLVPAGSTFDIQPGGTKFMYPMLDPEVFDEPVAVGRGIVARRLDRASDERFSRRAPAAPKAESNPFNVNLDRTIVPVYPESFQEEDKKKKELVTKHRLTGDTQFKPNSVGLLSAAQWIQDQVRSKTGIGTEKIPYTDDNIDELGRLMATEALKALEQDNNAIGWYDEQMTRSKKILSVIEPRIFESQTNESAFDWALAVTSNGQAVPQNFDLALQAFRAYLRDGRLPDTVKKWDKGGDRATAMRSSFKFFNQYLDMYNKGEVESPVHEFLDSNFSVKQLQDIVREMNNEFGTDIKVPTDELAETMVKGSFLAGPKIGQGFYQNLRGNFDPLTMDIWWMRMWNRLVNRPFKPETPQPVIKKKRTASRATIMEQAESDPMMRIVLGLDEITFPNKKQPFTGALKQTGLTLSELRKNDNFDDFVPAFNRAWNRYYDSYKSAYGRPPVTKETKPQIYNDMAVLEEDIYGALQATPANGTERSYMRAVTSRAKELLKSQGVDINTADLQALLWYPEKRLFEALGVRKGQGQDTDYAESALGQAKKEGISDEQIEKALSDPRSGQVGPRTGSRQPDEELDPEARKSQAFSRRAPATSKIIDHIAKDTEGFTESVDGRPVPSTGFVVAPVKEAELIIEKDRVTEEQVNSLALFAMDLAQKSGMPVFVGGWLDSETNQYYLDAVVVYDNVEDATYMANAADQKAIWDLGESNEINTEQKVQEISESGVYSSGRDNVIRGDQKLYRKYFDTFRDRRREELLTGDGRRLQRSDRGTGTGLAEGVALSNYPVYAKGAGPESGRGEFYGAHYTKTPNIEALDSNFHGAGMPGRELLRGWRPRTFFYEQKDGNLPRPEQKLEKLEEGYGARLTNIYDPRKDDFLIEEAKKTGPFDQDLFEDLVEQAGYDGYMNHGFNEGRDFANALVMLGEHQIPVVPVMTNKKTILNSSIDPSTKRPMYSRRFSASAPDKVKFSRRFSAKASPSDFRAFAESVIDTTEPRNGFDEFLRKFVGAAPGERLIDAFVRNNISRFEPGYKLDADVYGSSYDNADSVGRGMELSQQVAGRVEALVNLGPITVDKDGNVSQANDPDVKPINEIFRPLIEGKTEKEAKKAEADYYAYAVARREKAIRENGRAKQRMLDQQLDNAIQAGDKNLQAEIKKQKNAVLMRGFLNLSDVDIDNAIATAPPLYEVIFNEYQKFNNYMVKFGLDSGLFNEQMAEEFMNMAYVPFYRQLESQQGEKDFSMSMPRRATRSLMEPGAFDKELVGSNFKIKGDLINNIMSNNASIISSGLRNIAMQKTGLALERSKENTWGERVSPNETGSNIMRFRENGVERAYKIYDEPLWIALSGLAPQQKDAYIQIAEKFSGILRTGVTAFPGFMLANLWRGKIDAYIKADVPLDLGGQTIRRMTDSIRGGGNTDAVKMLTGFGGYGFGATPSEFGESAARKIRTNGKLFGQDVGVMSGFKNLINAIETVGESTEMDVRVGLYEQLLANGVSQREAAFQAMNLINYGRRGAGGGILGSLVVNRLLPAIPFLNARIQGLYRLVEDPRTPQNKKIEYLTGIMTRGALVTVASVLLGVWAMTDDRWEEERLENKVNYDIIYIGPFTIKLPRAFELGSLFGMLPVMTVDAIWRQDGSDIGKAAAMTVLNTLSFNPTPQSTLPLLEVVTGYDFFRMQPLEGIGLQNKLTEERFYASTPELYKFLSRNGGSLVGLSPIEIQNLMEGYLAGFATLPVAILESVLSGTGAIPSKPNGVFGNPYATDVGRSLGLTRFFQVEGEQTSQFVNEFYTIRREMDQLNRAIKDAARRNDTDRVEDLLARQNVPLAYRKKFNQVASRLSDINNAMNRVVISDMSPSEKTERLRQLRVMKNDLTRRYVEAAERAKLI